MQDNSPENDLRKIWQSQPTEPSLMTLEKIRQKVRELHAKTRKQLLGTVAGPLAVGFFFAFGMKEFPSLQRVLGAPFAFALAWSLIGLYFLNRGMWLGVISADMGFSTGLESCRREIERRSYLLGRVLMWSFGPVLLAMGTFILALAMVGTRDRGIFPNALPFLSLVVVWIFGYFVVRMREQRELQRELDELNNIERKNGLGSERR
jgi:hypothetical protein